MRTTVRNTIPWPSRPDDKPLCIAHRGASAHAPENTLKAFRVAAELGSDMWEIDVHLTADGEAVICHDGDLARAFGQDGQIADLTFAAIRDRAPKLPSLREVIALATELGQALYIEIKARGAGQVVWRVLEETGFTRAAIGSFNVEEIRDLAATCCPFPLAVLIPLGANPFERAEQAAADIIHLCWERGGNRPQELVTPAILERSRALGLGVVLWHEERKEVLDELMRLPVLGICTNQPELMHEFS